MNDSIKTYTLLGVDGKSYQSSTPGLLGGHKKLKIYGRLDCPSALRYIAKGQYVKNRVFFKDGQTDNSILNLQNYLRTQKRIFETAA